MEVEIRPMKSKEEDYEVVKQIARGVYGATFPAHHKVEKRRYVIKKIGLAKETETLNPATIQEKLLNDVIELEKLKPRVQSRINELNNKHMYQANGQDHLLQNGSIVPSPQWPPVKKQSTNRYALTQGSMAYSDS